MKVMVVDDEPVVLFVVARTIKNAGHEVLTAFTANEALLHIASQGGDIKAIFADLHLPGTDGVRMIQNFSALCPNSRIAVMTGFNDNEVDERLYKVFQKPFRNGELVAWLQ
jgi:DNA-binding NtrC family response regulator